MFRHKFRRTFFAMFWGWVVCNLVFLIIMLAGILYHSPIGTKPLQDTLWIILFWGLGSMIVILVSWLVVFLPVDICVPETSLLRKPKMAGFCGASAGFSAVLVTIFVHVIWNQGGTYTQLIVLAGPALLIHGSLAAITGLTAALHVVLKHPRQLNPSLGRSAPVAA